jgi:ligand-binding sensor domain-containing protein
MRTRPAAARLFGAVTLSLASLASADDGALRPRDARFLRLSTGQGLSQDTVFTIVQDSERFLWFGTEEGLNRYDGYSFKVFKNAPEDPASLAGNWIWRLYEDRSKRLWVGTVEGLSLYDRVTETFRNFRRPGQVRSGFGSNSVTSILEDRHGNLWIGTLGGGLSRVDPATGTFVVTYRHSPTDPASLSHDQVEALFEDSQGRLWVGTTLGLNRLDAKKGTFTRYLPSSDRSSLGHNWIWDMAEDGSGRLWVATYGGGLSVLDPTTQRFRHYKRDGGRIPNDWLTSVFVDRGGTIWAGTDGSGLLRYDAAADEFIAFKNRPRDSSSLSKNVVRSIYEDVQGGLWVGTYKGGVSMLQRPVQGFGYYSHDPLAPDSLAEGDSINAVLEDRDGLVWTGSGEGGLGRFDREKGTFVHHRHDPKNPKSISGNIVTSLFQDRSGRVWVGSHGGGLNLFDTRKGTFERLQHVTGKANSLVNDFVWAIAQDPGGDLWLGTHGGLDRFDPETRRFTHYAHDPADDGSLTDNEVRALFVEDNGDLWVGTLGGLELLPRGSDRFVHLRSDPNDPTSLSNNAVVSIVRDANGRTWIGTLGGGLDLFDPVKRKFTSFRVENGLPSDSVYSVCEDAKGRLWLGTSNGLARFDPETKAVKAFGLSNGLRSLHFNLGACTRTRDGHLAFGSADGFYYFDPAKVKEDAYVPPVLFTAFRLFGQPSRLQQAVSYAPEIRLAYSQDMFSLEFAALDFTVPRGNNYSYRVEGFHPEWTALGEKHEVTFTKLDPGTYTLQVRASNSDGRWNNEGASIRIVVTPPFWVTPWFRGLIALALAAVLFWAHRFRVRALHVRERELTRRVDDALARVKVLRGLLPMCAWCKKVRDDRGYWNQIEAYLAQHSEADFSHGICPDCARRISPGVSREEL